VRGLRWVLRRLVGLVLGRDPIVIGSKTDYTGSVSPSALNTETIVVDITAQTDDFMVEGWIDLSALASGDSVKIIEYVSVDGVNLKSFITQTFNGPVSDPIIRFHTKTLYKNMLYRVTITQTAGTLRSFPYAFILEVMASV